MFINDLPDTMPQADSFGYADDYKATFGAQSGLDRAVDALAIWLKENTMSVNISKAYIMKLRGRMTASLNKKCLPVTRSLKDFGRTVNDSLNWTENGSKRCSKELSALFQLRRNLGEKTHWATNLNTYNGYVVPKLTYASQAWMPAKWTWSN